MASESFALMMRSFFPSTSLNLSLLSFMIGTLVLRKLGCIVSPDCVCFAYPPFLASSGSGERGLRTPAASACGYGG